MSSSLDKDTSTKVHSQVEGFRGEVTVNVYTRFISLIIYDD